MLSFSLQQDKFHPQDFRSSLECDMPTTKIYKFQGTILHSSGERVPIGKDNLLLRECLLKNTDFVEGRTSIYYQAIAYSVGENLKNIFLKS